MTNADSIKKYGALYNWYVVGTGKLAPSGWHVPDTIDWNKLETWLIDNGYNWDGSTTSNKIAKSLASQSDWPVSNVTGAVGNALSGNNSSGFSAIPCKSLINGTFWSYDGGCCWWCNTPSSATYAFYRGVGSDSYSLGLWGEEKSNGFYVRLVKILNSFQTMKAFDEYKNAIAKKNCAVNAREEPHREDSCPVKA
jgi:uncharacterized protein (TIGR02145 family)